MQATDSPFTKILNGSTQFVIPVFQRDYSWTDTQCERLWRDVVRVGEEATGQHFIGSIVYVSAQDHAASFTRWLLIDGQQRLTTLTLLAAALRRHIMATAWQSMDEDGPAPDTIEGYLLRNVLEKGDRNYKLLLRRHDCETLKAVLGDDDPPEEYSTNVLENFEFFLEKVAEADPDVVYRGIQRLLVVDVCLDRGHDDPQMIFESLNSTGLDLTQADLIRNFILMSRSEPEQTALYEGYWRKIELLFRDRDQTFDNFARDYMALRTQASKQARGDEIYHNFRDFFRDQESKQGVERALDEMLRFATYHVAFSLGRGAADGLKERLSRLKARVDVAAITVMRLFDCYDRVGTLSEAELDEAFELI